MMSIAARAKSVLVDPLALAELFAISNLAFLAVDIYLAHSMNAFAHWAEWVPFVFSMVAPVLLVVAMALAGSVRPPLAIRGQRLSPSQRLSLVIGLVVGAGSIVVGIAGLIYHLESQFFAEQTLQNLVYTAPFVAPLAYSGIGMLVLLNRMVSVGDAAWARWSVLLALGGWIGNFV